MRNKFNFLMIVKVGIKLFFLGGDVRKKSVLQPAIQSRAARFEGAWGVVTLANCAMLGHTSDVKSGSFGQCDDK